MTTGTQPYEIVRVVDDAIALTPHENMASYMETRDFSRLALDPNSGPPTVYWGRPLTQSERGEIRNMVSLADQYVGAFRRGLVRVDNLEREDGTRFTWTRPEDRSGKAKLVPESDMDDLFDEAILAEIGMVIRNRSFLGRTKGRWYPLPDISRDALSAHWHRRAALTRGSSASTATRQPAAGQPATTLTPSLDGAASTDATVMAPAMSPPI